MDELSLARRTSCYHELKRGYDLFYEGVYKCPINLNEDKSIKVKAPLSQTEGLIQYLNPKVMTTSLNQTEQKKMSKNKTNLLTLNRRYFMWAMRTQYDDLPNS